MKIDHLSTEDLEAELERRKAAAAAAIAHPYREPAKDAIPLVHPNQDGFREKCTPKKPDENLFMFQCSCGGVHYRHAGYVEVFLPFLKAGGAKEVAKDQRHVMVCVACKRSYVWADGQMYEITDRIDLTAWEKTEKEMQKATGPGGDC